MISLNFDKHILLYKRCGYSYIANTYIPKKDIRCVYEKYHATMTITMTVVVDVYNKHHYVLNDINQLKKDWVS